EACRTAGERTEVRTAPARVEPMRLAVDAVEQLVRLFLMPLERPFRAIDFDPQIVLAAMRDLGCGHSAESAVLVADGGGAIVVELAAGREDLEQARHLIGQQAGDEPAEVIGVGADVTEAAGGAGLRGVGAPARLLLVILLEPGSQPALDVVG